MTRSAPQLPLVDPAYLTYPQYVYTLGPEVCDIAAQADFPPDPEQELALDILFGVAENGRSAVMEFVDICARQNMKTGLFKQAALGWIYVTEQHLVTWSAHEMDTTREAFVDLVTMIENCPALRRRLASGPTNGVYRGNGHEQIEFSSGQRIKFKARTSSGGRGLSGDKVILDEGFALKRSHMGSLMPTLSARPDPQLVIGSSAGHEGSEVLRRFRDRGRAGTSARLGYMEFCAPDPEDACREGTKCSHEFGIAKGCSFDDRELVRRANPAMDRRITWEYLKSERESLPPSEFGRERMGWWDKGVGEGAGHVIDMGLWADMAETRPKLAPGSPIAMGVDMTPDQKWLTISAAAWTVEKRIRLEVGYHALPGAAAVDKIMALIAKWDPCCLVINGSSPAKSIAPDLRAKGIEPEMLTASQHAEACGGFYLDAVERKLSQADDDRLTQALEGVQKRKLSGGAWVWDFNDTDTVLSPLGAATCARWGLMTYGVKIRPHQSPEMVEDGPAATDEFDLMTASF